MDLRLTCLLSAALLLGSRAGAAVEEPAGAFWYEAAQPGVPALKLAEAGLQLIHKPGVLVVHSKKSAPLARQVAGVIERMNRLSQRLVGAAFRVHGLVLVTDRAELPEGLRSAQWVAVGGTAALVMAVKAPSLPLASELEDFMVFPLLVHEGVDMGIKAETLDGRLYPESASSRWFVEGISDFCAYQASLKNQRGAARHMKASYLAALDQVRGKSFDLADEELWWPEGSSGRPASELHAYAAAHYAVWKLSQKKGTGWIRQALEQLKKEGRGRRATSSDFCRIAGGLLKTDVEALIRKVSVDEVRRFARAL